MGSPIKGWRERVGLSPEFKIYCPSAVEQAMQDEIAELRALLYPPEPRREKDPRQMDIMDVLGAPRLGQQRPACPCKPGQCEAPSARECVDWTKRGK